MPLSDGYANDMLNTLFGGVATTAPATYYVGFSTTLPSNTGTGVTEPSGGSYARVAVTNNTTNFPNASARSKSNGVAITFPTPTGLWGTCKYAVLYTASTGGTFLGWDELSEAITPDTGGSAPVIPIGGLIITAPTT